MNSREGTQSAGQLNHVCHIPQIPEGGLRVLLRSKGAGGEKWLKVRRFVYLPESRHSSQRSIVQLCVEQAKEGTYLVGAWHIAFHLKRPLST